MRWSEITSGAYAASAGGLLVPYGRGMPLMAANGQTQRAAPVRELRVQGQRVEIWQDGQGQVATLTRGGRTQQLRPYAGNFLYLDGKGGLWQIGAGPAKRLIGSTANGISMHAAQATAASLKRAGRLPAGWRLVWIADPVTVGQDIWYLSNRQVRAGHTGVAVWRHNRQGDRELTALNALGALNLYGSDGQIVWAQQVQTGALLAIDTQTLSVRQRLDDAMPLAFSADHRSALMLQALPGTVPSLLWWNAQDRTLAVLRLPAGVHLRGPAAISANDGELALVCSRGGHTVLALWTRQAAAQSEPPKIVPGPQGLRVSRDLPLGFAAGRVFLVGRRGGRQETWALPLGNQAGPL